MNATTNLQNGWEPPRDSTHSTVNASEGAEYIMQSLPIITYPYSWEPPKYHLGMTLFFRDEVHVCVGIEYQTTEGLEGWWYHYREGEGSVGCHESDVYPIPSRAVRQRELVY